MELKEATTMNEEKFTSAMKAIRPWTRRLGMFAAGFSALGSIIVFEDGEILHGFVLMFLSCLNVLFATRRES